MPLDIEAVVSDPIEAREGRFELLAEIVWEAGTIALKEAVAVRLPLAEDIDGVVEPRRPDGR